MWVSPWMRTLATESRPLAGGGVERAEVGDVESGEEVLLHVADAGLDAAFLVSGADVARCDFEAVMTGEVGVAGD